MGNLHLIKNTPGPRTIIKYQNHAKLLCQFILTGNPNSGSLPEWPPAAGPMPPVMILDTESKSMPAKEDGRYLILDKFYKNQ
jgi:para-nitrobenzyl esterase